MSKKLIVVLGTVLLTLLVAAGGLGIYFLGPPEEPRDEVSLDGMSDKTDVDVDKMLASANEHANEQWDDAILWEFTLFDVRHNGRFDLTSRLAAASFSYASPAELAEYQASGEAKPPCKYINVTPHSVVEQTRGGIDAECKVGVVEADFEPAPSCTFDDIWAQLRRQHEVPDDLSATVTYRPNKDGGRWLILGDGGFRAEIPDRCELEGEPDEQPDTDIQSKLSAVCDPGTLVEDGCSACPSFTGAASHEDKVVVAGVRQVDITDGDDWLMTLQGCAKDAAKGVSTVLVSGKDGTWTRQAHLAGVHLQDCTQLARSNGRQLIACISRVATRQGTMETLVAVEPANQGVSARPLLGVENQMAACDTERYMLDEFRDLHAADRDDDGDEDLRVMINRRQGELPALFSTSCDDGFDPRAESERVIYLNQDGRLERKP